MKASLLKAKIRRTIGTSDSRVREYLALQVLEAKIPISGLADILLDVHPVSTRFSWLLGDIAMRAPHRSPEILAICLEYRHRTPVKDMERVIARQAYLSGTQIPDALEEIVIDHLFEWLADPQSTKSTRHYAHKALNILCEKHPALQPELDLILEEQNSRSGQ
ncbi:MAG: hypothetical protein EP344_15165 [Bacteroidetes bacterium]|nr:MAG: hypothetical protein EP344_15165 [Bacteroidota bacterium]